MANEEQVAILRQGADAWHRWRRDNPSAAIDLRGADLNGTDFQSINLSKADLTGSQFRRADLRGCILREANLTRADLARALISGSVLIRANLSEANLSVTNLNEANLQQAILSSASLKGATLIEANLNRAILSVTNLSGANLRGASLRATDFSGCVIGGTVFGNSDLSVARGLDHIHHIGPSNLGTDTFVPSRGNIPDAFLRGCGLSNWEIEAVKLYNPDLSNEEINKVLYRMYDLRASQALQISPLFISYSRADSEFVDKMGRALNQGGIRYWRDIHEMKAGRIEKQIDSAIRQNPAVLLVLSEHSIKSDWVEHEVRTARGLEKEMSHDVLCPVALDDSWKDSRWPKRLMEQILEYNVLDFSAWTDDSKFDTTFRKLIDGLELFYKGAPHGE